MVGMKRFPNEDMVSLDIGKMMQEIGKVKFNHGVVPEDHVNLNIIVIADASKTLAGTVIHARFLKKELVFSCFHVQKSFQMDSYNLEQNYLLPP